MLLTLLLACPAADPVTDDTDTGAVDTGDTDTDTDSGNTDTDTDTDSGNTDTDTDLVIDLIFVLDRDAPGGALGLWRLDPTDGQPTDEAWETAAIGGDRVTIGLNDAPDAEEIDPSTYPGTYAAFYLPAVFTDADGDLTQDASESFVAVGDTYALWLEGTLPADFGALGLRLGWNAVRQPTDGGAPGVEPIDAIPLPIDLLPTTTFTVGGPSDGVEDANLALLPWVVLDGGDVSSFLFDPGAPIGGAGWSITVDGAPPDDHFAPMERGQVVRFAFEGPVAYYDTDTTSGISNSDTPVGFGCEGGRNVLLMWIDPPTDIVAAWGIHSYGYTVGWQALSFGGGGDGVPVADPLAVTLDCGF